MRKIKPKLKTKNLRKEYTKAALRYINEIKKHKGIIGILISGGLARGHPNTYSEVDIAIYLTKDAYKKWKKKAPIREGDHYWNNYWMDTSFHDYEKEREEKWSLENRWDKFHAKLVYDPQKKLKNLLKEKIKFTKKEIKELKDYAKFYSGWFAHMLPKVWIERGDLIMAHQCINYY